MASFASFAKNVERKVNAADTAPKKKDKEYRCVGKESNLTTKQLKKKFKDVALI